MSAEELLSLLAVSSIPTVLALSMLKVLPVVYALCHYMHRRKDKRRLRRLIKQGLKI